MIRPLHDLVAIEREKAKEKSEGGILLPDEAKEKPERGTIVAVGPGAYDPKTLNLMPMTVEVGDKVIFSRYEANEIEHDGKELILIRQGALLGVVHDEE